MTTPLERFWHRCCSTGSIAPEALKDPVKESSNRITFCLLDLASLYYLGS